MIAETLTAIITEARTALAALDATVTGDPVEAVSAIAAGSPALVVLPPSITYTTARRRTVTWTLWAIAPTLDPIEAVAVFEPILDTLAEALLIDDARAETYDIGDRTFPGYTITLTTEHN